MIAEKASPHHLSAFAVQLHRLAWLNKPIVWIVALTLVHGGLYAAIVPPWQGLDEPTHYEYLRGLWVTQELFPVEVPRDADVFRQVMASLRTYQFWPYYKVPAPAALPSTPPGSTLLARAGSLYYRLSFPVYWLTQDWPLDSQLYALRLYSVLLQCLTVWLTYRLASLIFPPHTSQPATRMLPSAAAMVAALFPQYTYISASYNDDNLVPAIVAGTLYALLRGLKQNASVPWFALACLGAVLAMLAKRTSISLVVLLGVGALVYAALWVRSPRRWRRLAGGVVLIGSLVGVSALASLLLSPIPLPESIARLLRVGDHALITIADMVQDPKRLAQVDWVGALVFLSVSFWGWFGYLKIPLSQTVMEILRRITLLLIAGVGVGLVQAWRSSETRFQSVALILLGMGLVLALMILIFQFIIGPPVYLLTGRYLFLFISAFAILAAWGWQSWWPKRWQPVGLFSGVVLLVVLDLIAVWLTIVPYYYS